MRFNLATGAFRICLSMPAGLYSIYWVDYLNASDTLIGIRGAVAYAALAFAYWMWARVTNRIGHRRLLIISALIGFYPITTGLAPSAGWLLLAAVIWGLFVAAIDIGFVDMLLLACPEGRQPTFVAAANLLSSAENFAGPLIGAALGPCYRRAGGADCGRGADAGELRILRPVAEQAGRARRARTTGVAVCNHDLNHDLRRTKHAGCRFDRQHAGRDHAGQPG